MENRNLYFGKLEKENYRENEAYVGGQRRREEGEAG